MSLTSAINTAQTIFTNTGLQTAVVAKNIANTGNADYSRRLALMGIDSNGGYYVKIERAQNEALFKQNILNTSEASAQSRLLDGLEMMRSVLGGNDYPSSPSNYLATFRSSLQTYAASPSNITIASSTISDAKDLTHSLQTASAAAQEVRAAADKEIEEQVGTLNAALGRFETVNNAITGMIANGKDASDMLDERDALLKSMSEIIGISTVARGDMDTVIYSSDGTVLFETVPRKVEFTATVNFDAATSGKAIYVDGAELKSGSGGNTTAKGTLTALLQLRDDVAPAMQAQLDEVARGLIQTFKVGSGPGLFTWKDGTVPPAGTIVPGLASTISVNALAEADPTRLRDGRFNGQNSNTANSAAFTGVLLGYDEALDEEMTFDTAAGLGGTSTLLTFASSSIGWLEQLRKSATTANENKNAMLAQTQQALSSATGVSLDEELSLMLDLEQSYKASARLMTSIDEMMTTLLDTVR